MAIAITLRDSSENASTSGQTKTSGSFTPSANSRLFVFCTGQCAGHTTAFTWSITDSIDGATGWTTDTTTAEYAWSSETNYDGASALFYKDIGGSPSAMTVTVDGFTGTSQGNYSLVVFDVTGTGLTFTQARVANGANVTSNFDTTSGTLTLGSAPTSGNLVVAMFGVSGDSAGACSTPSGYSVLSSQDDAYTHCGVFYNAATTTAAVTSSDLGQTVGSWAGIIMELNEGGGGGGDTGSGPLLAGMRNRRVIS